MPDVRDELLSFFKYIWQDTEGWAYVPIIKPKEGQREVDFRKAMFSWPSQADSIVDFVIAKGAEGYDTFYGPALYKKRAAPNKENILGTHVLWADFDGGSAPAEYGNIPRPTLRIQSSSAEGNEHAYWLLDEFVTDVKAIEERNRSIAYSFKADSGGWDATQFLRPPATTNLGIKSGGKRVRPESQSARLSDFGDALSIGSFSALPSAKSLVAESLGKPENIPSWFDVIALETIPQALWEQFTTDPKSITDRSGALFKLAAMAAESGMSDPSIYALVDRADVMWGKYTGRADREKHLIDIINRVRLKVSANAEAFDHMMSAFVTEEDTTVESFYDFVSFAEADFPVDWLLDGLLSVGGMGMFAASAGTGKTQMTTQLGAAIATGKDFLKWKNSSGRGRKVAFFSLEMGKEALNLFTKTMLPAYDDEDRAMMRENFFIVPTGNEVHLDKQGGQNYFNNMMTKINPEVIIIDSLQASTSKALTDEVAVKELNAFLGLLRRTHNCAVIMIHHNRKGERDNPNALPTMDDVLGHSLIAAPLDFALALKLRPYTNNVVVANVKNRLAQQIAPFDTYRTATLTFSMSESEDSLGRPGIKNSPLGPSEPEPDSYFSDPESDPGDTIPGLSV